MRADAWAALGAWVNGGAVLIAAGLAAGAWWEQRKFSRAEKDRESIRRVGDAISDLTSGPVAKARDQVASWTYRFSAAESQGDPWRPARRRMGRGDDSEAGVRAVVGDPAASPAGDRH